MRLEGCKINSSKMTSFNRTDTNGVFYNSIQMSSLTMHPFVFLQLRRCHKLLFATRKLAYKWLHSSMQLFGTKHTKRYKLMLSELHLLWKGFITVATFIHYRFLCFLSLMPLEMPIQVILTLKSSLYTISTLYFFVQPSTIQGNEYSSLCEPKWRTIWSLRLKAFPHPGKGHGNGFYV